MTKIQCPNCGGFRTFNRRSTRRNGYLMFSMLSVFLLLLGMVAMVIAPSVSGLLILTSLVLLATCAVLAFVGGPAGEQPYGCYICANEWDAAARPRTSARPNLQRMGQILLDEEAAAAAAFRRRRQQDD